MVTSWRAIQSHSSGITPLPLNLIHSWCQTQIPTKKVGIRIHGSAKLQVCSATHSVRRCHPHTKFAYVYRPKWNDVQQQMRVLVGMGKSRFFFFWVVCGFVGASQFGSYARRATTTNGLIIANIFRVF